MNKNNKNIKIKQDYDYYSRYESFPCYFDDINKKYYYGLTNNLSQDCSYVIIDVKHETTLDELASKYYGRPDLYWVIADFNHIQDPFIHLFDYFSTIKIPSLSGIKYKD